MPGGRPSIKKETVTKLEEALSIGADVTAACAYANITRKTYYEWVKGDEKLSDRFDALREKPVLKAINTINKNLDKPETAKWYLERKRKKEFSIKQEIDVDANIILNVVKFNNGNNDTV